MWAAYFTEIGAKREKPRLAPAAFLKQAIGRPFPIGTKRRTEAITASARGMQDGCFIPLSGDKA